MTRWKGRVLAFAVALSAACSSEPVEDSDFSGLVFADLAVRDLAVATDARPSNPDLVGYELTCDPNATLVPASSPAGSWTLVSACAAPDALFQLKDQCASTTFVNMVLSAASDLTQPVSGAIDLRSTGGFARAIHARLHATAQVPATCVEPYGGSCAAFESNQAAQFNWLDITCSNMGSGCTCDVATDVSNSDSGTWSATAAGFSTMVAKGSESFLASVVGNVLRVRGDATTLRGERGITYVLIR